MCLVVHHIEDGFRRLAVTGWRRVGCGDLVSGGAENPIGFAPCTQLHYAL
jgi:hypothetical protein